MGGERGRLNKINQLMLAYDNYFQTYYLERKEGVCAPFLIYHQKLQVSRRAGLGRGVVFRSRDAHIEVV